MVLTVIVLMLRMFDGKPQPRSAISLNTAVSFLAMYAKVCKLGLLSSRIGQLKWTWFAGQPRKLADLETFDSAFRGEVFANCKLPYLQRFK